MPIRTHAEAEVLVVLLIISWRQRGEMYFSVKLCLITYLHILFLKSELNIEKGSFDKLQVSRIAHAFHAQQNLASSIRFVLRQY